MPVTYPRKPSYTLMYSLCGRNILQNYLQVIQPLDMRLMHGARRAQPGDTTTEEPFGRETSSSSFFSLAPSSFSHQRVCGGEPG